MSSIARRWCSPVCDDRAEVMRSEQLHVAHADLPIGERWHCFGTDRSPGHDGPARRGHEAMAGVGAADSQRVVESVCPQLSPSPFDRRRTTLSPGASSITNSLARPR